MCPSDAVKPGLSCCAATAPAARGTIHSRPEIGAAALKAPEVPVTVRFSHVSVQVSYVYPAGGEPNVQVHAHAATVHVWQGHEGAPVPAPAPVPGLAENLIVLTPRREQRNTS